MARLSLLVLALLLVASSASATWPMARGDAQNTGVYPLAYGAPENVYWRVDGFGVVATAPLIVDDVVIIANDAGTIYGVSLASGRTTWSHDAGSAVKGTPAAADGRLYAITAKGVLLALDARTGERLDEAKVSASEASITIHEGKLFFGTENGKLYAYTQNLDLLWSFDVKSVYDGYAPGNQTIQSKCTGDPHPARPIRGAPAVYGDTVYFGSMNHYVYAVNERGNPDQTTDLAWRARTNDIVLAAPTVDTDTNRLLVASYDEHLRAYPLNVPGAGANICFGATPNAQWDITVQAGGAGSNLHASVAHKGDRIVVASAEGDVLGLTPTGQEVWRYSPSGGIKADPVIAGQYVVIATTVGEVAWLELASGKLAERMDLEAPIQASIAPQGLDTFVATSTGELVRLSVLPVPPPDLALSEVDADGTRVSGTITNHGVGPSKATTLEVFTNDIPSLALEVPALARDETWSFDEPLPLGPGLHIVRASVDGGEPESSQSDNQAEASAFVPAPAPTNDTTPANVTTNATAGLPWVTIGAGAAGVLAVATGVLMIIKRRQSGDEEEEEEED